MKGVDAVVKSSEYLRFRKSICEEKEETLCAHKKYLGEFLKNLRDISKKLRDNLEKVGDFSE